MSRARAAQAESRQDKRAPHVIAASPWEWAVGLLGLALIVGAVGYLAYVALTAPTGSPEIHLAVDSVERSGDGFLVLVTVANRGPTTAAALEIEGTLEGSGGATESSTASVDYLPRFSQRIVGLYFSADPAAHRLQLRPLGYAEP